MSHLIKDLFKSRTPSQTEQTIPNLSVEDTIYSFDVSGFGSSSFPIHRGEVIDCTWESDGECKAKLRRKTSFDDPSMRDDPSMEWSFVAPCTTFDPTTQCATLTFAPRAVTGYRTSECEVNVGPFELHCAPSGEWMYGDVLCVLPASHKDNASL